MSDDLVNIEVDGVAMQAPRGAMLIEVTDRSNVRVPRFCYHKKLSIAANCRMCLVEVERAPKPLPACATPVNEGMKVFTRSTKALDAQKSTMEFLLINHPLDCPICDQGGECELQDVAMGYGEDVSRYTESKRVVKDKDIGPLIATDLTRCIHCTRCVRFGTEIAGIRELGATGRGEFMQIGTFVEKAVTSELSGNVIDLCPVGALTAKPSRMAGRSWEMIQHATVAPHDCIGSNLYVHTLRGRVMRAVPRENESINETWLSDRDRFSYQGLYSEDRLETPMVKHNGEWQAVDWETALAAVVDGLQQIPPADVGALVAANATLEEMYLLQKLLRGIGSHNIDHRLRQIDFRDQAQAPLFPWLGQSVADLERLDAALLIGTNVRKELPIAAHRLRKAALKGAKISVINPCDFEFLFPVAQHMIGTPREMLDALSELASAALAQASAETPPALVDLLEDVQPSDQARSVAEQLSKAERAGVFLGAIAVGHPEFSVLRALASEIAAHTGARFGYFAESANTAGAWLAGAVPHRLPGGQTDEAPGLCVREQIEKPLRSYFLLGVEPEFDCENPARAQAAVDAAEFVVVCGAFASENTKRYADVLLPIATFAETSGTFVNAEGRWQSFKGVGQLPGEARPAWRVLRVLGNLFALDDFDYMSTEQVREEIKSCIDTDKPFDNRVSLTERLTKPAASRGLVRASSPSIYAVDSLVRRATALQQTGDGRSAAVYLNEQQAKRLRLGDVREVVVRQGGVQVQLPLVINNGVPMGCVWIPTGVQGSTELASSFGPISVKRADAA